MLFTRRLFNMMLLKFMLGFCILQFGFASPIIVNTQNVQLDHSVILDAAEQMHLSWSYNDTYIVFQLTGKTTGWMGVGINSVANMAGADISVMWINEQDVTLLDMYAEANALPIKEASQDLDLVVGSIINGETNVVFGRKLTVCDDNDNAITEDTLRVIYAYGENKPAVNEEFTADFYHGTSRGSRSIRLLSQQTTKEPSDVGVKTTEYKNDKVSLPSQSTYYHCRMFNFDTEGKKQHMVKVDPIVQEGNELYVHHLLVYICKGLNSSDMVGHYGHECYTDNMPDDYGSCRSMIFAWAIGGGPFAYPDHTGFPLENSDGDIFLMMEMHYDNPKMTSGVIDSSGIKVHYTPNLRENDAGLIEVGEIVSPLHFIPAGATNWVTLSECQGDCIGKGMGEDKDRIKIIAVMLHAHLFGIKLKLHHYRNGIELKPISSEAHYDFNYQEYNVFSEEIDFLKGDSLTMECVYDASESSMPIFGGEGTEEEMCIAFILYYPSIDIRVCLSEFNPSDLSSYLGLNASHYTLDQNQWYTDYYAAINAGEFGKPLEEVNDNINDMTYYQVCDAQSEISVTSRSHINYIEFEESGPNCNAGRQNEILPSFIIFISSLSMQFRL